MPRRLGEDPLSRKRRHASSRRQSGVSSLVSSSAAAAAEGQGPSSAPSAFHPSLQAIPEPPSFNEASFERSADDVITDPSPVVCDASSSDRVEVVPTPEPRLDAVPAIREAPTIGETPPPVVEASSPITEAAPTRPDEPDKAPPENRKTGFFSRIFGKFAK